MSYFIFDSWPFIKVFIFNRDTAGYNAGFDTKSYGPKELSEILPPSLSMKPEESMDCHFLWGCTEISPEESAKEKKARN